MLPGSPLTDIEYADDIALFGSDPSKLQMFLNKLNTNATKFGMRFAPSKCKVLLQDWSEPQPTFVLADQPIEVVDKFSYLGSVINCHGNVTDEVSSRISKARNAFANLRHLRRHRTVSLAVKGRVYSAVV